MPHLVILYTPNLETKIDMSKLCRALADTMLTQLDEAGKQVFPTGGTRVLAYPAAHYAVADGKGDYGFVYLNLRMGKGAGEGRSDAIKKEAGRALIDCARALFDPVFKDNLVGLTLQIDEGMQVFDGKLGNLHPLFQ
jgi:5-carboxymethyl-2-hydroxymuconate isomerase